MGKIIETRNLYKQTISELCNNEDNWISFLKSSSWNFKYDFADQILIYAQKPNARACAEMELWNKKIKRWVKKDADAIFVLSKDENSKYPFRLVFDVSDTYNFMNTEYKLWEIKPEYENKVIETLETTFGMTEGNKDMAESIRLSSANIVEDNIQDYMSLIEKNKNGTKLENLSNEQIKDILVYTAWLSVSYMVMYRCGINPEEYMDKKDFSFVKNFDNNRIVTILGNAISDMAEMELRQISRTVINLQKEEKNKNHTFVNKQKIEYSNNRKINKGGTKNGENRIQENRRLQYTEYDNEKRENSKWKIRKSEIELSKELQQSRIHDTINGEKAKQTSDSYTRDSNKKSERRNRKISEERESNRKDERRKSNEMGRTDEQLQRDSRGTSDEGANLQLDILTEDEQKQNIAEVENTSVFSFSQEIVDAILQSGSGFVDGKFRIYEQLTKGFSSKENANFLKNEYGIGGSTEEGIDVWYDSKGIRLTKGLQENAPTLKLTWRQAEKRIRELISLDRYFNKLEKDRYNEWLNTKGELTNDEKKSTNYEFNKGNIVYIGAEEYEIRAIDENRVILVDTSFPILTKEMEIKEFENKVKDTPANDKLETKIRVQDIIENTPIDENIENQEETEFNQWLDTFIKEKGIDLDYTFTIEDNGLTHIFELGNVIENIKTTSQEEQNAIKEMIVKIDFNNGDVVDYFKHLAKALVKNYYQIEEQENVPEKQEKNLKDLKPQIKRKRRNKIEYFDLYPEIPLNNRNNFIIKNDDLGIGTLKEKYSKNIKAIKILKICNKEKRYATIEEQKILSEYVGWGSLQEVFDPNNSNWSSEYEELKKLLTEEEYEQARNSTTTAFYTPPIVIKAMYKALKNMGLEKGNILEPSCGIGNFMGMIPQQLQDCKIYGVEIDSISGQIARQLYQKNTIAVKGFEEIDLPNSFFDVAIGNVPFADFKPYDKKYDKYKFLLHDYFFAKTLDKVRPNGVIAFITSKGTLDKQDEKIRKYIAQRAELIGAIRLPENTFKKNAGTTVTTDIIFLKKRDKITDIDEEWVHLGTSKNGIKINNYFVSHPEMIMGNMEMKSGPFGEISTCKPYENVELSELLDNAIDNLDAEIEDYQIDEISNDEEESIPAEPDVRNFSYTIKDEKLYYRENSQMYLQDLPLTTTNRIKGMIEIRDCVRNLIELQTEDASDEEIKQEQKKLNYLYDNFKEKYGIINSRANEKAFSEDDSFYLLCSLEVVNESKQFIRKADMFHKRTIKPNRQVSIADNSVDALILSISEKARVDLEYMSKLTGKTEETLIKELEGSIYKDPIQEKYITADEYLSGNVREKLKIAKEFAENNPEYETNVKGLESVKIKDLSASEISVRLGATWIPPQDIEDFIFELLETSSYNQSKINVSYSDYTSSWNISGKSEDMYNERVTSVYGTKRINAYHIIEKTLNLKSVKIFDTEIDINGKEKKVLNAKETAIAQSKQDLIKTKFEEWIWRDQKRRERLTNLYNEKFNCIKPREYDGQYIVFSGMNPEITLRKHQLNAIARILYGGNTLLAHEVGAGKTFEMVAAAMESKRLGLCNKSLFVVPNHIIEQFASEFMQLYPSSNILVTTKKDFAMNNRKKFCSKIATGEYDAIIMGHSQFEKIQLSKERQAYYIKQQIKEIGLGINDLKNNNGENYTIKQLEKSRKKIEEKLKRLNDSSKKDNVITFEQLGVDRLFVDEAHYFKNLYLFTKMNNVGGIAQTEAQKSSDLFMKCRYLDELTGGKGIVFATRNTSF